MNYLRHLAMLTLFLSCGQAASAEPLFFESFESGDMSGTNEDGFRWSQNNKTSVVTMDPLPLIVWENGAKTEYATDTSKDWTAKTGDYSLRFKYDAAGSSGQPQWTEQRFNLGGVYPEIWLRYWVRVPVNYSHGTGNRTNHKFFAIWMDGYEGHGQGATVVWEMIGTPSGASDLISRYRYGLNGGANTGWHQYTRFVEPSDAGRWMEITIHVKAASIITAPETGNGVIEMWRRWENEASPVKFHEWLNAALPMPDTGEQGWNAGYFFGWTNAPYAEETEWLIDRITISKESLLNNQGIRPNPPSSIHVN